MQYLKHWHRLHRQHVLLTVDEDLGRDPLALVRRARDTMQREARDERRGRGRAHDQIWCVFDRDEHERFADAVALAASTNIDIAVSNPCLELWFLLHFQDQTAYLDRTAAQHQAKQYLRCGKAMSPQALELLTHHHDDATGRARALEKKHADDGSGLHANPSSTVWRLVNAIRDGASVRH